MNPQWGRLRGLAGERGSLRRAIVAPLAVGLITFSLLAAPALLDRGRVSDDVLHGAAIPVSAGCAFMLMAVGLAARGTNRDDRNGGPRPDGSWRILAAMLVTGLAMIAFFVGRDYRRAGALSAHGVPAQARLVREFDKSCGHAGCSIVLEYSFIPQGRSKPARGFARVGYGHRHEDPAYTYAKSTGTVPILYDPVNPDRSALYWGDRIARSGSALNAVKGATLLAAVLVAALAPLALGTWLELRRRRSAGIS